MRAPTQVLWEGGFLLGSSETLVSCGGAAWWVWGRPSLHHLARPILKVVSTVRVA